MGKERVSTYEVTLTAASGSAGTWVEADLPIGKSGRVELVELSGDATLKLGDSLDLVITDKEAGTIDDNTTDRDCCYIKRGITNAGSDPGNDWVDTVSERGGAVYACRNGTSVPKVGLRINSEGGSGASTSVTVNVEFTRY